MAKLPRATEVLLATKGGFSLDEIALFRKWLSDIEDESKPSLTVTRIINFLVQEGWWT